MRTLELVIIMGWRVEMVIQAPKCSALTVTKVTFVRFAIESKLSRDILSNSRDAGWSSNLSRDGDGRRNFHPMDRSGDVVSINPRVACAATFNVIGNIGRRFEHSRAEWTFHICRLMDTGSIVLQKHYSAMEDKTISRGRTLTRSTGCSKSLEHTKHQLWIALALRCW